VLIGVACAGNAGLDVRLTQDGAAVPGADALGCGGSRLLRLETARAYLLQLSISAGAPVPAYVRYTVRVEITG
jgi:hypothetical protein